MVELIDVMEMILIVRIITTSSFDKVLKKSQKNILFFYNYGNGEIFCNYAHSEYTSFPDCKKIPFFKKKREICRDIGDWSKTQNLLEKGHQYLFRDKDGDARETLSKKSDRPRFEDIKVKGCYEGDSCTKK